MKKQIYQSPRTCVYKLMGKTFISTSVRINTSDKVSDSNDIGFVKEDNSQSGDNSVWDDEW